MKPKTSRTVIGSHTILQNGPTLVDLKTHPEFSFVTNFQVFHEARQIATGWVECAEVRWDTAERMPDAVKAIVESMLENELPEFEEAEAEREAEEQASWEDIDLDRPSKRRLLQSVGMAAVRTDAWHRAV